MPTQRHASTTLGISITLLRNCSSGRRRTYRYADGRSLLPDSRLATPPLMSSFSQDSAKNDVGFVGTFDTNNSITFAASLRFAWDNNPCGATESRSQECNVVEFGAPVDLRSALPPAGGGMSATASPTVLARAECFLIVVAPGSLDGLRKRLRRKRGQRRAACPGSSGTTLIPPGPITRDKFHAAAK